ncbi:MAG TPA: phage major capsid protein [Firmicutes bacterium]|nr:phage major capsid protein [Bacillota bacterium]
MVTLQSAENALKTLYLGVVSDQLNTNVNPLLAAIEQTASDVWGKEIRKLAPYGINGGIGAGTETGDLPAAAENNYAQFVLTLKNLYGTIEISDKAIRASQNNAGAFVNLLNAEMEGLLKASKFNFGRMLYGDGTGTLTTVESASGNNVVVASVQNLIEGMVVDVLTSEGASTGVAGRRITSIDRSSKTITLSGNVIPASTLTKGNIITVQGSYKNELTGLGAIFGTGSTLYGLSKTANKWLNPRSYTSTAIDDVTIQKVIDEMDEVAGSKADFIVCSFGVKRAYQEYLTENKSNVDIMNLAGGYKAISYNGIPVVSDRFAPSGTMYVLDTTEFHLHQLCDWRWLEGDNGKIIRQVAGKPVYTATLVKYADLICDKPSGQAKISGITEK